MANEFREAAEALYLGEFGLVNTDDLMIGLLARAMEMAADAGSEEHWGGVGPLPQRFRARVAARVKGRIENGGTGST